MIMLLAIIILILWLYLLVFSANHLINTSVRIAKHFNVSDLLIWLTILAIWTSAPELFLSWMAAVQWSGSLSIWNIIWSNIFNLWIILWVSAIAAPVAIQKKISLQRLSVFTMSNRSNFHNATRPTCSFTRMN